MSHSKYFLRNMLVTLTMFLLSGAQATWAEIAEIGYSFARDGGGGVVVVQVDTTTGKIVNQRILLESDKCTHPLKVRRGGPNQLILTNATPKSAGPHLYLIEETDPPQFRSLELPELPDEVRVDNGFALLTCEDDWVVRVDLKSAQLAGKWNAEDILDPPGNGPEDIFIVPDRQHVVVSFQKDNRSGKKHGSRIGVFRLPDLDVVADARLPRSKPELHTEGNNRESGPGPEVIHISEENDTILVTLDLYGAVAVADWCPLLAGKPVDWLYLSTATDGSWGNAFPDRMSVFQSAGREVALVANAGTAGGVALLDVKAREFIWRGKSPAGLETPVYVAEVCKAFSVCSGKTKRRGKKEVKKIYRPQPGVYVCDVGLAQTECGTQVEQIPTEHLMYRITRVRHGEPWLLLAGGKDSPDTIMVLDARTGEFVDEQAAIGALIRFEGG